YYHHEKWDGSGYPMGLQGEEIPVAARITAFADVYDALTSERVYKTEFSHDESIKIMEESKGTHLDPHICEIFVKHASEFKKVKQEYSELE
ncbi:MAG: two-component system response regulator, partial [Calditrichia bacterium]|nr:two-component system response regulator [Calditrichia bacterium]